MRRPLRSAVVVVATLLLVFGVGALTEALAPRRDEWLPVVRRDLVLTAELEGELEAEESELIGPPQVDRMWNFKISMMAPEGAEVKEGAPVLAFDATELQQKLRQQQAERDSAEKELEKTTTDLEVERRSRLLRRSEAAARLRSARLLLETPADVVAHVELAKARIDLELAELEVSAQETGLRHLEERRRAELSSLSERRDRAAGRVAELEVQISRMTVAAPRSGTVIYRSDWRGDKLEVGETVWRGVKVLEIPDLERMRARATVAESEAGRIEADQPVTLRLDAYPDRPYAGRVRSIGRTVQRRSPTSPRKVVQLLVELAETDRERMRPGMRFRGAVEVRRLADVLVVPAAAVRPRPGGAVVVARGLAGTRREVVPELGDRSDDAFEVLSGLAEGDRVLVESPAQGEGG